MEKEKGDSNCKSSFDLANDSQITKRARYESSSKQVEEGVSRAKGASNDPESAQLLKQSQKEQGGDGLGQYIANHYNSIQEKGLEARNHSRIVFMRNFNNWIKSILIMRFLEKIKMNTLDDHRIVALDLGCGKGGDIVKWQKGNVHHVIFADIAATSIDQCKERYEHCKSRGGRIFTSEYIVADFTKCDLKKYTKVPSESVDIVSSQFSFHYCFESLMQAETMIKNVSEALRPGGYFIATCPDANKIIAGLNSSKDNTWGNEVFRIQFPKERNSEGEEARPTLFGDKYNFFLEGVVDCPEFLVHFGTLVRLCKKYKLEFEYRKSFADMYEEGVNDRETKTLMFRMKALELYPPPGNSNCVARDEESEYAHAKQFICEKNVSSVKTLSKSEWEAICLYMGFAFKKVR